MDLHMLTSLLWGRGGSHHKLTRELLLPESRYDLRILPKSSGHQTPLELACKKIYILSLPRHNQVCFNHPS